MSQPVKEEGAQKLDDGIEAGISGLTAEKIVSAINAVIDNETGARLKTYVDTCIHCGLCSEACHFYLSHEKDPQYSPETSVLEGLKFVDYFVGDLPCFRAIQ